MTTSGFADDLPAVATQEPRGRRPADVVRSLLPLAIAVAAVTLFYVARIRARTPEISGDEGHYLAFARALSHGSFDLRSVYRGPLGSPLGLRDLPTDQTVAVGTHLRSIRMPLLPALLAPAMRVGSVRLVHLTMGVIGVAFLFELWQLLRDIGYGAPARWSGWLTVLTALPVLGFSMHVFPEMPGALAVVVILRCLLRSSRTSLVAASVVAGLMPWLIVRFALLSIAFAAIAAVIAWRRYGRRNGMLALAPYVASLVGVSFYTKALYGSVDPRVLYPPAFTQPWTLWHAYEVGIGSLVGATDGLVPYAPAMIIGLVGLGLAARRFGAVGWVLLGVTAAHLLLVVPMGFFGAALPGRFVIVLAPFLAVGVAEVVARIRGFGVVVAALVILQVALVASYRNLNELILERFPHRQYLVLFPPNDQEPGLDKFDVGHFKTTTGGVLESKLLGLRPGEYQALWTINPVPTANDSVLGEARVLEAPEKRVIARQTIRRGDGHVVAVIFRAPGQPVVWRNYVYFEFVPAPAFDAKVTEIVGRPVHKLPPRIAPVHDRVWQGMTWIFFIVLAALASLRVRRRRDSVRTARTCW